MNIESYMPTPAEAKSIADILYASALSMLQPLKTATNQIEMTNIILSTFTAAREMEDVCANDLKEKHGTDWAFVSNDLAHIVFSALADLNKEVDVHDPHSREGSVIAAAAGAMVAMAGANLAFNYSAESSHFETYRAYIAKQVSDDLLAS